MQNKKLTYSLDEAKKKLENYCVYQERCHQEIELKLKAMGMIPLARDAIFLHLLENDFINEERFSKSYARGKSRMKAWGRQRIIQELRRRNISKYNIESALKEINEEEYLINLKNIAIKRFDIIKDKSVYKKNQKIIRYLLYKGYESDLIYEIVREISEKNK